MSNIDIELGLITSVLDTGDMKLPVTKKITPKFFHGSGKTIWEFMMQHYREYKKSPDLATIQRKFPQFAPIMTNEPPDYFIKELQERQTYNLILEGMQQISQLMEARNVVESKQELARLISKVNTEVVHHRDVLWNEEVDERIARMEHKMQNFGITGISYGIEPIDIATGGMNPADLITIVAKPGTGKTFLELAMCARPALVTGNDVLFISREMEERSISDRMDALMFEIGAEKMKRGLFTTDEFENYKQTLYGIKDKTEWGRLVISADDEKGFGLTAIQAKIEEHLPNGGVVIIDGSYLLDDDEGGYNKANWEKIMNITRGLKRMARRTQTTIIQSSQFGRGAKRGERADLDNMSFSSSFEQDSDIVWQIWQTPEMKAMNKMGIEGSKVREGDNPRLLLNWNFDTMKDFGVLAQDITDAPDDDEDVIVY